jgi:N-acetylglucosamine kinase
VGDEARSILVGVDGGGTHTVALVGVCREPTGEVTVLGRGEGGPSNPQAVGFEAAAAAIDAAIRTAIASAGFAARESVVIGQAALGISGAQRPVDRSRLAGLVAERLLVPIARLKVVEDVWLILPAAGLDAGIALIAGTGSNAFGLGLDGRSTNVGGWGYLIGDDGSAFDVGREALRAVLRADDGFGPATRLVEAFARELGISQPRDLIRVVYQSQSPRSTIATLAPLVVDTARSGDEIAQQILAHAGQELGKIARAVARRLSLPTTATVVGTGGMFKAGELLLDPLRVELARAGLTDVRVLDREPAFGALRLATGVLPL